MARRRDQLSVYVPENKKDKQLVERLEKLAEARDRSVNYLVVQAIAEFLEREEGQED
ncbi:MAG: ribbon-helix-helix domain-containing protein [Candidatus Bipolaricaulota bacterium]